MANQKNGTLLTVENLSVRYKTRAGWVSAIDNVSLEIRRGEVLGLVGESGCGKSTLGKALLRMLPPSSRILGHLWFDGQDLMQLSDSEMRRIRGKRISMVFQDPMTSLNPVQRVGDHIVETIQTHEPKVSKEEALERAGELFDRLGISRSRLKDYPHQLSGGMRQRVMIAIALALKADLIIADEATTSLDVIVEAQIIELLKELRDEFNLTILLITHNIGLVAELADRILVMYAGQMAELSDVYSVFKEPLHPYTQGLLNAVPNIELDDTEELYIMEGTTPDLIEPPPGCRFHPRCPYAMPVCSQLEPHFQPARPEHYVHCWLHEEIPAEFRQEVSA
ncbi:MAG: ABC transporter ATP-binding protein [Aggregatilineales bacterium]